MFDINTIFYLLIAYFFLSILAGIFFKTKMKNERKKITAFERIKQNIINSSKSIKTNVKYLVFKHKKKMQNKKKLYIKGIIYEPDWIFFIFSFSRFGSKHILFCTDEIISTDLHREEIVINAIGIMKKGFFYLPLVDNKLLYKTYKRYNEMLQLYSNIEENTDLYDIGSISLIQATEPVRRDKSYMNELLERKDEVEDNKKGIDKNAS